MTIYLASDHAGFILKEKIKAFLAVAGHEIKDFGPFAYQPDDDYPDFMHQAACAVAKNSEQSYAFLFGGDGQGEAMVANRYRQVRAAVFYGSQLPIVAVDIAGHISDDVFEVVRLVRRHNNANVLSIGARFVDEGTALKAVSIFLETPFSGDERHVRRIGKIDAIEQNFMKS